MNDDANRKFNEFATARTDKVTALTPYRPAIVAPNVNSHPKTTRLNLAVTNRLPGVAEAKTRNNVGTSGHGGKVSIGFASATASEREMMQNCISQFISD
jgi:hypothetical protein